MGQKQGGLLIETVVDIVPDYLESKVGLILQIIIGNPKEKIGRRRVLWRNKNVSDGWKWKLSLECISLMIKTRDNNNRL